MSDDPIGLLADLVRIHSVNPGSLPAAPGRAGSQISVLPGSPRAASKCTASRSIPAGRRSSASPAAVAAAAR